MAYDSSVSVIIPEELKPFYKYHITTKAPSLGKVVINSGFSLVCDPSESWDFAWNGVREWDFLGLSPSQIMHHIPGMWKINYKDTFWSSHLALRKIFPDAGFDFIPRSFILPSDKELLKKELERQGKNSRFLAKDPRTERANGISMVMNWTEVEKFRGPLVVQEYIKDCHLINGKKYDMRLYLYIRSVDPLKLFLYKDGLVRFASKPYSQSAENFSDVYMHITNTNVQKNVLNEVELHWSVKKLIQNLESQSISWATIWKKIKDIAIKTIIPAESQMIERSLRYFKYEYRGGDLIGLDVMLDSKLKPWLVEINLLPQMSVISKSHKDVKGPMLQELLNIEGLHVPCGFDETQEKAVLAKYNISGDRLCLDLEFYKQERTTIEMAKQEEFIYQPRSSYLKHILKDLTFADLRQLMRYEDELAAINRFEKIFPTPDTHKYLEYLGDPHYSNRLLDAWESKYGDEDRQAGIEVLQKLWEKRLAEKNHFLHHHSNKSQVHLQTLAHWD